MNDWKRFSWALLAALALAACSDDDDKDRDPYPVISFETSEGMLDLEGRPVEPGDVTIAGEWAGGDFYDVFCGKAYMTAEDASGDFFDGLLFTTSDRQVGFGSYFTNNRLDPYGAYDVWGGFVLSRNYSMRSNGGTADYRRDGFSAWAATGANGSDTFAIGYDNGFGDYRYHTPKIVFAAPRKVASLYLANATVAAQYVSGREDYWFKVVATGYRKASDGKAVAGASVEQMLISGRRVVEGWTRVDCTSLGEVDELRFRVESNDRTGDYLNCPAYFCIDEIAFAN